MDAITYSNGQVVKLGDNVEVSSFLGRVKTGKVIYVYNPGDQSGPNGKNDYGISILLGNGKEIWGMPGKNVKLVSRLH